MMSKIKPPLTPKYIHIRSEGVEFHINFKEFAPGDGAFIPCLNTDEILHEVNKLARVQKTRIKTRVGIFNGKWGIAIQKIS